MPVMKDVSNLLEMSFSDILNLLIVEKEAHHITKITLQNTLTQMQTQMRLENIERENALMKTIISLQQQKQT